MTSISIFEGWCPAWAYATVGASASAHTYTANRLISPLVAIYGTFALTMGISELLFVGGLASEVKHRATPIIFAIHALAGAVVLIIGPLQSVPWIRRRGSVRLALGRTYVIAV
jgi:hypothetical protein